MIVVFYVGILCFVGLGEVGVLNCCLEFCCGVVVDGDGDECFVFGLGFLCGFDGGEVGLC